MPRVLMKIDEAVTKVGAAIGYQTQRAGDNRQKSASQRERHVAISAGRPDAARYCKSSTVN